MRQLILYFRNRQYNILFNAVFILGALLLFWLLGWIGFAAVVFLFLLEFLAQDIYSDAFYKSRNYRYWSLLVHGIILYFAMSTISPSLWLIGRIPACLIYAFFFIWSWLICSMDMSEEPEFTLLNRFLAIPFAAYYVLAILVFTNVLPVINPYFLLCTLLIGIFFIKGCVSAWISHSKLQHE
ncbi:MAG: hypothetical protein LBR25_06545 [Erysipelotrichaceae bacterium]|jgi:hypothetical protein|nr:hypothetical protein [Erysipelotrichaceae bacterium]